MKIWIPIIWFCLILIACASPKKYVPPMQEWQYSYPVQYQKVLDSLHIAYVEVGKENATILLFLHGLGSNLKAWEKNMEGLKNKYHCIAIDFPGYGKSSRGAYPFDMTFFAKAVNDFIKKKKLENVTLVGHSMGGQVSVNTLLSKGKSIENLILIAPAGFETFTEQNRMWFKNIYTPTVVKMATEEQIVKNFELNFYQMPTDAQFMIEDRLLMKTSSDYDNYCNMIPKCVMGMLEQPVFDDLKNIKIPTLIIFGKNDQLIPNRFLNPLLTTQKVAELGQQQIGNSQLEMIDEAGHFVNWEKSATVNSMILGFLQ